MRLHRFRLMSEGDGVGGKYKKNSTAQLILALSSRTGFILSHLAPYMGVRWDSAIMNAVKLL